MKILYFSWLRSRVGQAQEMVQPPQGVGTVTGLIDWLKTQSPAHAEAFANLDLVRCAVNQEYVPPDHPVAADDEIAFFPPVTGG